jgi:hypothetical protein
MEDEPTCGQEMAASAEIPSRWQALMNHVALNMERHAAWVGTGSAANRDESAALLIVAQEYRSMADAAGRAAAAMTAMADLAPASHDASGVDRPSQARWMRLKIDMQRDLASLLIRHAEESEAALGQLERP